MMFKKILAALTAMAIIITAASCGKQSPEAKTASKEHVYREERIELSHDFNNIHSVFYSDGKIYIIGGKTQSSGSDADTYKWTEETAIQIIGLDGKTESRTVISTESGDSYNYGPKQIMNVCGDVGGGIVTIDRKPNELSSSGVTFDYFLTRYSETGEKLSDVSLNGLMEELGLDDLYIWDMTSLDDGAYLIMSETTIAAIDGSGRLLYEIKDNTLPESAWFHGFVKTSGGRLFTSCNSYGFEGNEYVGKNFLVEIDTVNKKFGERYRTASNDFISGSDEYDLYVMRESGLAGYDIETGETETVIDWLKSGYDATIINNIIDNKNVYVLPDGRILCVNYEYEPGNMSYNAAEDMYLSLLTEIPPEEIPDKKQVKLYALSIDTETRTHILEFNKNSPEYAVELTSYEDYIDGADRMNIDMVSGNIPDVILLSTFYSNDAPAENYIAKGLFADVYEFMDSDPEMEREDFLDNVLKAYEVDGRLYQIVPSFEIETIVCRTSAAEDRQGWTTEEFIDFAEARPDCAPFNGLITSSDVLGTFINSGYESYIDIDTGRCSFDSGEFIRLLEFCGSFPNEIPDEAYTDYNFFTDDLPNIRSGKQLFYTASIYDCSDIRYLEKGIFQDGIAFMGYPVSSGSGSSIRGEKSFAITKRAANPDGAWQFVRYFLTEEYQDGCADMKRKKALPIRISSLEKQAETCRERPYYIDPLGEKQYYDNTFFNGYTDVNIGVNTDEDNAKIIDFIKSADSVYHEDKFVLAIIEEEAGAFFAGQKSAEETAEIIQNRVQNYLDENR